MPRRKLTTDQRVNILTKNVPKHHIEQARELAQNIVSIEDKLKDSRDELWNAPIVIPYDNGGGQKGFRENPVYKAYVSLLLAYEKAINQLNSMRDDKEATSSLFDWNK